MSPEVKLIFINCISKLAELPSKCAEFDRARVEKKEKIYISNIDFFCPYFDNRQKFAKEGDVSKKSELTDLSKPPNPGEVVVLAKSATLAYKSSYVRALDQ